ncbi:MAG TPA: YkgJ family cysteine cluster protein [Chitinophagaceae bacterium]|nr:YkgJ family cysteine cluster protein [Chitinophagaceae bacterium]
MSRAVNLRSFRSRVRLRKTILRKFLTKLQKKPPRGLDRLTRRVESEVWREVDCLSCANCCREMSPTYNRSDIRRISAFLGVTTTAFREKWLYRDRHGDWLNRSTPCQFLNLQTNQCGIYDVRPADCAGFPHFSKKKMVDFMHVHKQNISLCPATYKMVEKMMMYLHKNSGSGGRAL